MFNYLAFLYGGIPAPGADAVADGGELARRCLAQMEQKIDNPEQFPPGLLILLASPAYLESAEQLLAGVHQAFAAAGYKNVPLIGSSVAAVFYDQQMYEQGALLICLASRVMSVKIAAAPDARNDMHGAASRLLDSLELNSKEKALDPNPLVNRLLLAFLPGFGKDGAATHYPAPELHRLLRDKVSARVPIVGGGSSAGDKRRPGRQFANHEVFTDAIVAARVTTAFPFCSSIGKGLDETRRFLRANRLAPDGRTVTAFAEGRPAQLLELQSEHDVALLGQLSLNRDPIVTSARLAPDGQSAVLLRECKENTLFEILKPNPRRAREEATKLISLSLQRLRIENPIGCLGIHCASRRKQELNIWELTADTPELRDRGIPYVGGFFDGEFGQDTTERSLFGNWCFVIVCFGDEMRERAPLHRGFRAIADYAPKLTPETSLDQAIEESLELIFQTGFSGAMLSLVLDNARDGQWIVARRAKGARFAKIVDLTKRPLTGTDVLTVVAKQKAPLFIRDSRADDRCNQPAVELAGLVSQYLVPLCNLHDDTVAVLQIDLGDASYKEQLHESERQVLKSLGAIIGSTLLRLLSREENNIARDLDKALQQSLAAASSEEALQQYLTAALAAFGADAAHIRLAEPEQRTLQMAAGVGDYHQALQSARARISFDSASPTARAYRQNDKVVVNDAPGDEWHRALCQAHQHDEVARAALAQVGAYANVAIKDGHGAPIGTISLLAHQPWFFTRPLVRSLDALSQRVGFLLEHWRRKEQERRAQRQLQFLFNVGPQFVRTANFEDPIGTLTEAVRRSREAAQAHLAALFLWDDESQRYILRAQAGWHDDQWVHVARYQPGERFTGRVAQAEEPLYVADVQAFKEAHGDSARHYALPMFGQDLSADFVVEAIGLPLKLKQKTIGVLTLYRRVAPDQTTPGFTTTNPGVLREAANNMAAMVSAQLYYRRVLWEKEERRRQDEVCEALQRDEDGRPFAENLCRALARSYRAVRAQCYWPHRGAHLLSWAAGYRRLPREGCLAPSAPDALLNAAARERRLREKRHKIAPADWDNPELARTENLIERVCLPLLDGDRLLGMLDLHWGVHHRDADPFTRTHDRKQLERLAQRIAAVYKQQESAAQEQQAKEQAERSRLAVQAMGAMVFQTAHRLMNLVQELYDLPDLIAAAQTEAQRNRRIEQLASLIHSAGEKIQRPLEVARHVKNTNPQLFALGGLLAQVRAELNLEQLNPHLEVTMNIPADLTVWSDQELIHEAFRNIMHNAVKAMPAGGVLSISAFPQPEQKIVRVVFADSGKGMSQSEIEAAQLGFVSTQSHTGLGVLVSILLSRANGGDLEIESKIGRGTKVTVTLPLSPAEESG